MLCTQADLERRTFQETVAKMKAEHLTEMERLNRQHSSVQELETTLSREISAKEKKIAELTRRVSEDESAMAQLQQLANTCQVGTL